MGIVSLMTIHSINPFCPSLFELFQQPGRGAAYLPPTPTPPGWVTGVVWVPILDYVCSGYVQSVFRVCSECVQSMFRVCSILKSFHHLAHLVCQFLAFSTWKCASTILSFRTGRRHFILSLLRRLVCST